MKSLLLALLAITVIFSITIPTLSIAILRKIYRKESISDYLYVVAIGFDQAGGSILYGQEDWTVSSWTYHLECKRNKYAHVFRVIIDLLFGKDHCKESFEKEARELNFKMDGKV